MVESHKKLKNHFKMVNHSKNKTLMAVNNLIKQDTERSNIINTVTGYEEV